MNNISIRKILMFFIIFGLSVAVCEAQSFKRYSVRHPGRSMNRKTPKRAKEVKIREPRKVEKAKRIQQAKEKQNDEDYKQFVRENRKRSIEIQTPEVQERMRQNIKDAEENYKIKKKRNTAGMKRAGRKYRR
jgi:hypothetical protein